MKYELHNKYDVFTKVKRVIESCKTNGQLTVATAMLDNFESYYKEDDNYLRNILNNARYKKLSEIINKSITKAKSDESK